MRRSLASEVLVVLLALALERILTPILAVALAVATASEAIAPGFFVSYRALHETGDGVALVAFARLFAVALAAWFAVSLLRPQSKGGFLGLTTFGGTRAIIVWSLIQAVLTTTDTVVAGSWGSHERSELGREITDTASNLPLFLVGVVAVAPLTEELLYRGLVLGPASSLPLRSKKAIGFVLASATVWALEHSGNTIDLIVLFVSGCALAGARLQTRSLWAPYWMHVGHNAFAAIMILRG